MKISNNIPLLFNVSSNQKNAYSMADNSFEKVFSLKEKTEPFNVSAIQETKERITENFSNVLAQSSKILTSEQVEDLKNKYDVENLSSNQLNSLLSELEEMQAISAQDRLSVHAMPLYNGARRANTVSHFSSGNIIKELNSRISIENELLEAVQGISYVRRDNTVNNIDKIKSSHEKLLEIFSQLL